MLVVTQIISCPRLLLSLQSDQEEV